MKKILVADDDQRISFLMQVRLEEKGYQVITAKDGEEALEKTRELKPDLLILDVRMPKMDGDDVYLTLRSFTETRRLPIFMLTGLRTESEIEENHEENIFAKPVNFDALFSRIKTTLGE